MKPTRILIAALSVATLATMSSCKTEVRTDANGDSTAVHVDTAGTTSTTPNTPSGAPDTAALHSDSSTGVGQEIKDESVEKMVEAALVAKPGYENVTVESAPDGVIILNGSVKTAAEKTEAEATAKNTAGVKKVTNNLTVAP